VGFKYTNLQGLLASKNGPEKERLLAGDQFTIYLYSLPYQNDIRHVNEIAELCLKIEDSLQDIPVGKFAPVELALTKHISFRQEFFPYLIELRRIQPFYDLNNAGVLKKTKCQYAPELTNLAYLPAVLPSDEEMKGTKINNKEYNSHDLSEEIKK